DQNPIRTHEDYSKPSHEGYRNTIELPKGNNVVPLRFECFIEYYHENYLEDFKSDLENLEEVYKMMNGGVEYPRTRSTSPSKTYASYKPSPRIDPFEQPPCLGSTFVSKAFRKSD
ncbi:hypothetical protein Tco_1271174, partial [Tanacetum coccineum]